MVASPSRASGKVFGVKRDKAPPTFHCTAAFSTDWTTEGQRGCVQVRHATQLRTYIAVNP